MKHLLTVMAGLVFFVSGIYFATGTPGIILSMVGGAMMSIGTMFAMEFS